MLLPRQRFKLARGANDKERAMSQTPKTVGIDIGKNSFHVVGHDERGAIVLRQLMAGASRQARSLTQPPKPLNLRATDENRKMRSAK